MFEISPETACMIYVGSLLLIVLSTWVLHSHTFRQREIISHKSTHHICEFCSTPFLADSLTSYHRCPLCKCLNTISSKKT